MKYHYENKHFAIVRFHDFLSRTCIGVWSLIGHLGVFCEPLRSGLNPAYIYKQKKVTLRTEIMKLCEIGAQRGPNGDLKTLKT